MERLWDYQRHAAECLLLAEELQDSTARGRLLALAQAWSRLAELAEKNARTDLVYEAGPVQYR